MPGPAPREFTDLEIDRIKRYSERGATQRLMAEFLDIPYPSFKKMVARDKSTRSLIKRLGADKKMDLLDTAYTRAKTDTAVLIFLLKTRCGLSDPKTCPRCDDRDDQPEGLSPEEFEDIRKKAAVA